MEFSLEQVAHFLGGQLVQGDAQEKVNTLSKIEEGNKGSISFLSNSKYEKYIYITEASAVIIKKGFSPTQTVTTALIEVEDPYAAFTAVLEMYDQYRKASKIGVSEKASILPSVEFEDKATVYIGDLSYIGENVKIGKNVKIYPQAYIGDNTALGDNTTVYAGVKIYANTIIGQNCTFQSGAVIGSDGFGFAPLPDGTFKTIPQIGNVVIEDNVDIGANTVVDCATMGSTIIKSGTKLDNLIQVAHNVVIGKNTVVAAQSGISGSTKLGQNCMIGGQVGIVGHIELADQTKVGAQSGVSKSVKKKGIAVQGSPAFDYNSQLKSQVVFKQLPNLEKRIKELEEKIVSLSK